MEIESCAFDFSKEKKSKSICNRVKFYCLILLLLVISVLFALLLFKNFRIQSNLNELISVNKNLSDQFNKILSQVSILSDHIIVLSNRTSDLALQLQRNCSSSAKSIKWWNPTACELFRTD